MADEKKLSLSGRKPLGAGAGGGQVRQSFSHGRTKPVVVERKRRKLVKKTDAAVEAPKKEAPAAAVVAPKKEAVSDPHLTTDERDARAEALKDAMIQAEEARYKAGEEKRVREEETSKREADLALKTGEERRVAAEEDARHRAEEDARARADEEIQKKAEEAEVEAKAKATDAEAAASMPPKAASPRADEDKKKHKDEKRKTSQRPTRGRGDQRRRSGKLTVSMALGGDQGQRQRSLAALRRAQAKQKRAGDSSDDAPKRAREIVVPEVITVRELSNRMAERARDVIKVLKNMDVESSPSEELDQDTAELVVAEFGHTIRRVSESDVEIGMVGDEDKPEDMKSRPPVVTVMGHVDHGKTSLLDAMRATDVASGEAGGITQHIGAYQIETASGRIITFIDTPGHAAFTAMRARGASVTDIVVLVVAADDGIMPQTVEAINHAKAAGVPMIVAINKMDKEGADPGRVRQELLQHEVMVEAMSGDVLDVEVSAIKKTNLDKLEEAIHLQAELLELKANPNRNAEGIVIEARLDKGRGPVATVLVQRGTLRVGDILVAGAEPGRVRALADDKGRQIKEATPGQPVEVLGLGGAPAAGDNFSVVEDDGRAREVSEYRRTQLQKQRQESAPVSLEDMFSALKEAKAVELPLVVKADVQGSLEAITAALTNIGNDEIQAVVIHGAVGGITESDITLAHASKAPVIGFNVRANAQAREAAEAEHVVIDYYSVIYNLIDAVKAAMIGELGPAYDENILGRAEIKDVFTAGKTGKAAGCLVLDGTIRRTAKARLLRDDVVVYEGELSSLRRFKDDVEEVKTGTECGMTMENYSDIKVGDQIEAFELVERERTL